MPGLSKGCGDGREVFDVAGRSRFNRRMSLSDPPIVSRRQIVFGGGLTLALAASRRSAATPRTPTPTAQLIAGTYAREGGAGVVPLIAGRAGWTTGRAQAAIRNASFGVAAGRTGPRYLLDEQRQGMLGIYDRNFRRLAAYPTLGADPCHAALSPDRSMLAVANYSSGDVAVWRLDPATGLPRGAARRIPHEGQGPNRERQAGPHAHWVGFTGDGAILHSVDLGADAIFAHRVDSGTGQPGETTTAYRAEAGSGPRHLARHPRLPVAYLVAELANTVTTLQPRDDGTFTARDTVSTLPRGHAGASAAAHIAVNAAGTRLYVSNRGHDSIAVFAIGGDGALTPLQHVACGGHWPRFFLLREDRREMLVANERSGNIASLTIDHDGRLRLTEASVRMPGVVFLAT